MKIVKMSLANMQGKMSRMEMKGIMAGLDDCCDVSMCCSNGREISCSSSGSNCSTGANSITCGDLTVLC